ncbi:Disease resistance protein RGA2 [Bienertia sinuspersici]
MRKLTNLRSLDVNWCDKLTHMPSGIEELTLLNKLPRFIVGHKSSIENSAKLSDLKNLNNLRGVLNIYVHRNFEDSMLEATEANLSHKHGLTNLNIRFIWSVPFGDADCEHDEAILEGLKPNSNLRILGVNNYEGQKLPSWARMDNLSIIPNLVRIIFFNFGCCKQLPTLSQLHFLKDLVIANMESVEYMEDCVCDISSSKAAQGLEYTLFFPSLEVLELSGLRNLKGWWKLSSEFAGPRSMQFSKLSSLIIDGCPNLIMLPLCPMVEDLTLSNANKRMLMLGSGMKLKRLTIGNAEDLMSLSNHCLHQLSHLTIIEDRKLESSERLVEIFATLSSSLRSLTFNECHKLRSISKGLEHLTALDNLRLICCEELDLSRYEAEVGMPWKALNTSLRSLELYELDKLVGLPNGLQHLANLHSLILTENRELKELPEWIDCFTSLEYLELYRCPNLKYLPAAFRNLTAMNQLRILQCPMLTERCRHPNAVDWPKIQHIPLVSILD